MERENEAKQRGGLATAFKCIELKKKSPLRHQIGTNVPSDTAPMSDTLKHRKLLSHQKAFLKKLLTL